MAAKLSTQLLILLHPQIQFFHRLNKRTILVPKLWKISLFLHHDRTYPTWRCHLNRLRQSLRTMPKLFQADRLRLTGDRPRVIGIHRHRGRASAVNSAESAKPKGVFANSRCSTSLESPRNSNSKNGSLSNSSATK